MKKPRDDWEFPKEEGIKLDIEKLRYSLLDPECLELMVKVLEYGAKKYPIKDNWKSVKPPERYYDALMRHLQAWRMGKRLDEESGLPALAHATVDCMFLLWHEYLDKEIK